MIQPNYLKSLDVPGGLIEYGDLSLRFLVDEDMVNYTTVHNWITGLDFQNLLKILKILLPMRMV